MDRFRIAMSRLAGFFGRQRRDDDLDEELQAHLDLAVEEGVKRGLARNEARQAALREFGGVTQVKESYRMQRGAPFLEQIHRDVFFGIRQLRKSPGFALTAIITLALGLGANTAVFSLINALLLRPLPVPHSNELAIIHYTRSDDADPNYSFSAPMFRGLEKRHDVFEDVAAFSGRTMQVRMASGNVEISGAMVSGEFFPAMQVQPLLGRYLTPQDDRKGGSPTGFGVVISEGFWQSWFNRAPDVVGRPLTIADVPFTVVGVMPGSFIGGDPTARPQIYVPLWSEPAIDAPYDNIAGGHHNWWLRVMARRRQAINLTQANAALAAASNAILDESSDGDAEWAKDQRDHHFVLLAEEGSKGFSYLRLRFVKPLVAVFAMCGAMLLLACLNLASLLMARSAARERELATRLAMGATRGRLIQQLMAESVLIALLGTAAGILAAPAVSQSLASFVLGNGHFSTLDTTLDLRVFAFISIAAIAASVIVGLIPALRATSKSLNEQIKSGSNSVTAGERKRLLPRMLMALEVSLALILVVGAGLLATSLASLYRVGLGFDPKGVVNLSVDMSKQERDGPALLQWYQQLGDTLHRLPGVKAVSFSNFTPMSGSVWTGGYKTPYSGGERDIHMLRVSPDFFATMRIPLMAGRDFRWNDTKSSGLKMILNQSAAKLLFPNMNPIGQHLEEGDDKHKHQLEIIGVVGDIHYASIRDAAPPGGYAVMTQDEDEKKPSYVAVLRIEGSPGPIATSARAIVAKMAPEIPAPILTTLSSDLDANIASERMMALLAVFFAVCALLVTGIGLYGTLAYATARRTSEIGIRMALGAQRAQVIGLVFRENAWIALCGSALGLIVALIATRALASFLFGLSTRDPWVMLASVATLGAVASAASIVPALRASRIEPIQALRTE